MEELLQPMPRKSNLYPADNSHKSINCLLRTNKHKPQVLTKDFRAYYQKTL